MSARRGVEYVINRPMYLCNLRFSWRVAINGAMNGVAKSSRLKTCLFLSTLSIRICYRSAQFPVNCFEEIFMAANSSGFNSAYMFACK